MNHPVTALVNRPGASLASESAPRRSVNAANQPRGFDWFAGIAVAGVALAMLAYAVELGTTLRLPPVPPNVGTLPFVAAMALWFWLNRVELELCPDRIVIRSRWRRLVRAQPRELVLPGDAAIVVDRGKARVGGWPAGTWSLKRIAAVAKEAGVAFAVLPLPRVNQTRARRLASTAGAFALVTAVFVAPGLAAHVWDPSLSLFALEGIAWSVWLWIASLAVLVVLWGRLRSERTVPGDAIEPVREGDPAR